MMRNIETFPSKQMYPYLSLVERKVADFYHNIDRRRWLVWSKWLIFITFSGQFVVSLGDLPFSRTKVFGISSYFFIWLKHLLHFNDRETIFIIMRNFCPSPLMWTVEALAVAKKDEDKNSRQWNKTFLYEL